MKTEDINIGRGAPDASVTPGSKDPRTCTHGGFRVDAVVSRMEDTGQFVVDIRIFCVQCNEAFRFLGLPAGLRFDRPTVSIDETELHAPIEPEGDKKLQTRALFQMPERLTKQ